MFGDEKQSLFYNPLSSLPLCLRPARSCSRRERRGDLRGRLPARSGRGRQCSYPSGREPQPPAAPRLPPPPLRSTTRAVSRSRLRLLLGARRTRTPRSRVEKSAGTSPRKPGKFPRTGREPSVHEVGTAGVRLPLSWPNPSATVPALAAAAASARIRALLRHRAIITGARGDVTRTPAPPPPPGGVLEN